MFARNDCTFNLCGDTHLIDTANGLRGCEISFLELNLQNYCTGFDENQNHLQVLLWQHPEGQR
jgi:hypothetical protein